MNDEDYSGTRGYYRGNTNWLCLSCGKSSGHYHICCAVIPTNIGPKARVPKITASRKQWKAFCKIFKIDMSTLTFLG